ncbi:MAG TPA: choice-of-anchor Q domain-containing protein [Solirubrobacteraceae bacterium]|nr:choice-of-anchor Q domain-containing protein [Solirubrobacteraceae bacterium]
MSWDRVRRVMIAAVALLVAAPAAAQATNVTVINTNDSGPGSLRAAIATSGVTTIDFAPGVTGTITLTGGVLSITQSLIINGPGAGVLTINGNNDTSFDIAPNVANQDVTISGLTITGGRGTTNGGGILAAGLLRTLTLSGDTITGNQVTLGPTSAGGGGGVYVNGADLVVTNSTIDGNSVTLTGSAMTPSSSSGGGGIYSNAGSVTVTGSDVSHNSVDQASSSGDNGGGGIYSNAGAVELDASTVLGNSYQITSDNGGDNGGGGVHSESGGVTLSSSTVNGNSFTLGPSAGGDNGGGGIYANGDEVDVVFSSIDGNALTLQNDTGGSDGGAGLASEGGDIGVAFSSISNNTGNITDIGGDDGGGAILDEGGTNVYLTSTFSGNTMTLSQTGIDNGGGAIYAFGSSLISNLTIAGNRTSASGGAILNRGPAQIKDTIITSNAATPAGNCAGTGTFTSAGFNLESANSCGFNTTGDLVNTDPLLGPVQNNGGLTPTQALPAGSPAVDTGSCTDLAGQPLTIDQRGVARPQPAGGKCDIGAYELAPSAPPPPPPSTPPAAVPGLPTATSSTAASFSGSVNPNGQATTVFFQYGIDSRFRPGGGTAVIYDQSTPPQTLPADSTPHAVSASVPGLVPNALYHVRLVATNASGTTNGPDQTFTTPAGPAPPPPVLGQKVNAAPVSGQVFILVGTKLVPLTEAQQIPSGAILDTRAGTLQLTAAGTKGHKPETGVFGGAIFKLTQAHNGLTNLALAEGALPGAPTFATCKAHKAGEASAAASKTLQLLHASAKGKFRTTGRYSAATVRGTKWTIADRCDGTLTRDIVHSVVVTDFVRHKTIVLHAGQSYLAKARKARHHK